MTFFHITLQIEGDAFALLLLLYYTYALLLLLYYTYNESDLEIKIKIEFVSFGKQVWTSNEY